MGWARRYTVIYLLIGASTQRSAGAHNLSRFVISCSQSKWPSKTARD